MEKVITAIVLAGVASAVLSMRAAFRASRTDLDEAARRASRLFEIGVYTWLVLAAAFGAVGFFSPDASKPPPIALGVGVPLLVGFLVLRGDAAKRAIAALPTSWLVSLHGARLVGFALVLGYFSGILPARFGLTAGIGDVLVALAAPWVARHAERRPLVVAVWSLFGMVDLLDALAMGVLSSPSPLRVFADGPSTGAMGTLPLVLLPAFLVPLLIGAHLLVAARLVRTLRTPAITTAVR